MYEATAEICWFPRATLFQPARSGPGSSTLAPPHHPACTTALPSHHGAMPHTLGIVVAQSLRKPDTPILARWVNCNVCSVWGARSRVVTAKKDNRVRAAPSLQGLECLVHSQLCVECQLQQFLSSATWRQLTTYRFQPTYVNLKIILCKSSTCPHDNVVLRPLLADFPGQAAAMEGHARKEHQQEKCDPLYTPHR